MNPRAFGARRAIHSRQSTAAIDRRLAEIDSELNAVEQSAIDPGHVAAALAEFNELWDVLYPQEKTRIVHLLVERVVYRSDYGNVQIAFHTQELRELAPDLDCVSSARH